MNFLSRIAGKNRHKKTEIRRKDGGFTDAYQESLNKMGQEQFSKIVNRGILMPGLAAL